MQALIDQQPGKTTWQDMFMCCCYLLKFGLIKTFFQWEFMGIQFAFRSEHDSRNSILCTCSLDKSFFQPECVETAFRH